MIYRAQMSRFAARFAALLAAGVFIASGNWFAWASGPRAPGINPAPDRQFQLRQLQVCKEEEARMPGRRDIPFSVRPLRAADVTGGPIDALRQARRVRSPVVGAVLLTVVGGYGVLIGESGRHAAASDRARAGLALEQRRTPVVFPERDAPLLSVARHVVWPPVAGW